MTNKIVAVVGMCGSGKSEITNYFSESGYFRVHFGDLTFQEVKRKGLELNEANERIVREELRNKYGLASYAIQLLPVITEAVISSDVVLDGLYSWSEYKFLKENFGSDLVVLAVVANHQIRAERLSLRLVRPLTLREVESRDISEVENLEKGGPIARADYYILNNTTKTEMRRQFEEFLRWMQNQK